MTREEDAGRSAGLRDVGTPSPAQEVPRDSPCVEGWPSLVSAPTAQLNLAWDASPRFGQSPGFRAEGAEQEGVSAQTVLAHPVRIYQLSPTNQKPCLRTPSAFPSPCGLPARGRAALQSRGLGGETATGAPAVRQVTHHPGVEEELVRAAVYCFAPLLACGLARPKVDSEKAIGAKRRPDSDHQRTH